MAPLPPRRRRLGLRWLWWPVLGLIVVGGLIVFAGGDPGYVLVSVGRFSLETSLWLAVGALLLAYIAARLLGVLWRALFGARGWWRQRRVRQARQRTVDGLMALLMGDNAAARKQLLANVNAAESPELNLMFAARAAHAEGDHRGAELYLQQAEAQLRPDQPAATLLRLEQALQQGNDRGGEPPINELRALRERAPRSPGVLRALATALERGQQWDALRALVSELRKHEALDALALTDLERRAWRGAMRAAPSADAVRTLWKALPRAEQKDSAHVLACGMALQRFGAEAEAEVLVREALGSEWQHQLVTLYGLLRADLPKQVRQAEQWLAQHTDDGALLQAFGRLQAAGGNWEAARHSFQAALQVLQRRGSGNWGTSSQRCSVELAEALLRTGDTEGALVQLQATQG